MAEPGLASCVVWRVKRVAGVIWARGGCGWGGVGSVAWAEPGDHQRKCWLCAGKVFGWDRCARFNESEWLRDRWRTRNWGSCMGVPFSAPFGRLVGCGGMVVAEVSATG